MLMLLVFLVSSLSLVLVVLLQQRRKRRGIMVPPGPPPLPLIGNLHQFRKAKIPYVYLRQLSKKYGPLMHMKLGPIPVLIITSPELAKQVLKIQDSAFCSRPKFIGQYRLAYYGLDIAFSPYGEYWREVKKIFSVHHVSNKKIQSSRAVREDESSRLVARISASPSKVGDLSEILKNHIISLILRISFGFDDGKPRFADILPEVVSILSAFYVSDYFPSFSWVDKFTGATHRLDEAFNKLDSFYQDLIDDHLCLPKTIPHPMWDMKYPNNLYRQRSTAEKGDILDILIQMKEEQHSSSIHCNSWDNIKALLKNILLGGIDTSAATLVWIMTALIKSPKAMEKVQAEIRNLVGDKGRVDEDDLPKLAFLKAVVKETLRLYPPFPLLVARETIQPCTLGGYEIPLKTVVYVNAWAIARDPEHWENPDEFVPERFLNDVDIDIKGQDFQVLPFGSGRRICPGMNLGLANVELTAANLLYSFDWEMPPGVRAQDVDTDPLPGVTMHKKNPLLLVPKNYVVAA